MKMGTVDVERYTGPCLITTAVRPKAVSNKIRPTQNEAGDRTPPPPPTTTAAVVMPVVLQGNNDAMRNWAGAPLLSMAASIRKCGGPGKSQQKSWLPPTQPPPPPSVYLPAYAAHLQGAPLIRVPRHSYQPTQKRAQQQHQQQPPLPPAHLRRPYVPPPPPLKPPTPLPASLAREAQSPSSCSSSSSSSASSTSSSDTCSVTSDEGLASGGSESSLPRIIKPRRRKKHPHQQTTISRPSVCKSRNEPDLSDLDALLSDQGDPLAELFRASASIACSTTETTIGVVGPSPICWPAQQEDDIWGSSPSWHSLSPTWSSSSGSSSVSSWPVDQQQSIIRQPVGPPPPFSLHSVPPPLQTSPPPPPSSGLIAEPAAGLQVSSQLIASPFNGHRDIEIRFFSSTSASPSVPSPE